MADLGREQFEAYLKGLGLGEPLVERGLVVVENVERVLPGPITHIFVSEYRDGEGNRNAESLWLLTKEYMSESIGFPTEDRFDIVPVRSGIVRLEVNRDHFDFTTPTEQSRLMIDVNFSPSGSMSLSGSLKASGENCLALTEILQEYLLPLLNAGE